MYDNIKNVGIEINDCQINLTAFLELKMLLSRNVHSVNVIHHTLCEFVDRIVANTL